MKPLDEILVIVPTDFGVDVCPLGDLMEKVAIYADNDFDTAVEESSIDMLDATGDELKRLVTRIRKSNAAPDFCYWEPV